MKKLLFLLGGIVLSAAIYIGYTQTKTQLPIDTQSSDTQNLLNENTSNVSLTIPAEQNKINNTNPDNANVFGTCNSSTTTPFLVLTSPNNGGTFASGSTMTVKWKGCLLPDTEKIFVALTNTNNPNTTQSALVLYPTNNINGIPYSTNYSTIYSENTGSSTFILPSFGYTFGSYDPGNYYIKVSVSDITQNIYDYSSQPVNITAN